jgi:hypothetical protein
LPVFDPVLSPVLGNQPPVLVVESLPKSAWRSNFSHSATSSLIWIWIWQEMDFHFVVILGFLCDMAKSAIDLQVLVARGLQLEKAARATSFLYIEVKLYLF